VEKDISVISFFSTISCQGMFLGIWVSNPINWKEQPGEYPYADDANILYFSDDGKCRLLRYLLVKDTVSDSIAVEPNSGSLLIGTWTKNNDSLFIQYTQNKAVAKRVGYSSNTVTDTLLIQKGQNGIVLRGKELFVPHTAFDHNSLRVIRGK